MNRAGNTTGRVGEGRSLESAERWQVDKHEMNASMFLFIYTSCVKGNMDSASRPKSLLKNACSWDNL